MQVVFRVFSKKDSGLGHLVRCMVLANALNEKGHKTFFILDEIPSVFSPFLADQLSFSLDSHLAKYANTIDDKHKNEYSDAEACLALFKREKLTPEWVVVDHYGLSKSWEKIVQKSGHHILAIDDIVRHHSAHAILDFKWRGTNAKEVYLPVVPVDCQLLLGPQYLLISPPTESSVVAKGNFGFRLLISLGGGGNACFLKSLICCIAELFAENHKTLHIKAVVGPLMTEVECLFDWQAEFFCGISIELINGKTDLSFEYRWCDFYLGAAGGAIYSLRAIHKPSLLISFAENQENDQAFLDDIGQYFYLRSLELSDFKILANLMLEFSNQLPRVQLLFKKSKIKIGFEGPANVVAFLETGRLVEEAQNSIILQQSWQSLINDYMIRSVSDADINHYLQCRNYLVNRQNMLDNSEIPKLHHYAWWMTTKRRSFLLTKNDHPMLYIWDEIKTFKNERFLIGGWFVCSEAVSHQEALLALDWQLKTCAQDYPDTIWVAVINRQNRFVKLMNDYLGFKEMNEDCSYNQVVNKLFPNASREDFFYVYK